VSHVRHQRRKLGLDSLQGELRKIKPPSFDGEREREDDVEAWLLGLISYFQLHKYSSNLEARISTYHSHGKATMLWDQLKQVEHINEGRITWKQFKTYFQKEYLSKNFYDKKMEEFFELRLGSMTMAEYENTFPGLLKYVGFIKDEKVKIPSLTSSKALCYTNSIRYANVVCCHWRRKPDVLPFATQTCTMFFVLHSPFVSIIVQEPFLEPIASLSSAGIRLSYNQVCFI
jgi:hypothetical protein